MIGIDISNWQAGLNPSRLGVEFCICKATEGQSFVDPYCDGFIQDCKSNGIPYGFYHFALGNFPEAEAKFFYDNCMGYIGEGIPVLDFEVEAQGMTNAQFCERFIQRFHDLSGVWPILYISASRCSQYNGSWIPEKCGLWVAGYPYSNETWPDDVDLPYDVKPWEFAAIWQFTSSLKLTEYQGKLDGNIAFMDKTSWMKYATSNNKQPQPQKPKKSADKLAIEVIAGKYGNGDKRKRKLGNRYDEVMQRVNEYYRIADEVITGKWSNGWNRKQSLKGAGYDYNSVQRIVNAKLRG